ncbi:MAG: hypothetical protein JRM78_03280 [Nitrososphaerota archaeon]|nr:hypothetical protein [Nitrososphaerota archaeon]MDG7039694.1 hypothetical protein [Nitrososphaerota archaeon]
MKLSELVNSIRSKRLDPDNRGIVIRKTPVELLERASRAMRFDKVPSTMDLQSGVYKGERLGHALRLYFASEYYRIPPRIISFNGHSAVIESANVRKYSTNRAMAEHIMTITNSALVASGYTTSSIGGPTGAGYGCDAAGQEFQHHVNGINTPALFLKMGFTGGSFRLRFYQGSQFSRMIIAHQAAAELYGLSSTSYACHITGLGERLFLYFSDEVAPPSTLPSTNPTAADAAADAARPKLLDMGELLAPSWVLDAMMERGLFNYSYKFTSVPMNVNQALEQARTSGFLHPNFSLPLHTLSFDELRSLKEGFIGILDGTAHFRAVASSALTDMGILTGYENGALLVGGYPGEVLASILEGLDIKGLTSLDALETGCGFKMVSAGQPVTLVIPLKLNKAKPVKTAHGIFPSMNGNLLDDDRVVVRSPLRYCVHCMTETPYRICPTCGEITEAVYTCAYCKKRLTSATCPDCGHLTVREYSNEISVRPLLQYESHRVSLKPLEPLKGITPVDNTELENLGKALVRQYHSLMAQRTGIVTVKVDVQLATDSWDRNMMVAYSNKSGQALKVDEIMLPVRAANALLEASRYIDDELERVYGLEPYYKLQSVSDLLGRSIVGLDAGSRIGLLGRVVGILHGESGLARDEWVFTINRAAPSLSVNIILLGDLLLNFSGLYVHPERKLVLFKHPAVSHPSMVSINVGRPRNLLNAEQIDDPFYLAGLQLDAINRMAATPDNRLNVVVREVVLPLLSGLEQLLSTWGLICASCGAPAGVAGLRNVCAVCGGKLEPSYSIEKLKSIINKANLLTGKLEGGTLDELNISIEALRSLVKSKKQFSLSEYT